MPIQTQNIPPSNLLPVEKPKFHLPGWLAIMIISALAISAGALIYLLAITPAVNFSTQNEIKTDVLPKVVNSYVGQITALGNNEITVKAEAVKNYLKKDSLLTIKITAETLLTMLSFPKTLTDPSQPLALTKENIKFKDLKIGQNIVVFAAENIKNKTAFTADSVEVQAVK
jgi:hypothetical protein